MARTAREKSKSGIYHIILRGLNRQTIFYDDEDRKVFLNRLKIAKEKYGYSLYAFCLMDNHIHLIIKEKNDSIGKVMQHCLSSYVYWYNSKYERIGNLFQDRFKSEAINDDNYLISAVRYVHQNPLKANIIIDMKDYLWGSYNAYINKGYKLVDTELVLNILQGFENYIEFMKISETKTFLEPTERYRITDDKLLKEIIRILKIKDISELNKLSKKEREESLKKIIEIDGANLNQISRVTGININILRKFY
jgi:putative transposase